MKIGIDLGGTKTEAILINNQGIELFRKRIVTEKNYEGTIKGIQSLVKDFEKQFGEVESVGIGMPGAVSLDSSLVKNANSIWLNGKPLKKDLEKNLKRKINLENDANCFALSEAVDGAGRGYKVVFGVIIGTGVGGGIVIDQKVISGVNKISGEWGHISLPYRTEFEKKHAKACYCGHEGCIETYVSGPGFEHMFYSINRENLNSHQITEGYINKDNRCTEALKKYVNYLARGLTLVINILDPDVIVLGGGMSNINFIYENIDKELKKYVFSDTVKTKIVKHFHGDSSGVRGAAWL